MLAGSLEIELFANIARLQKDMESAKRVVDSAGAGIEKMVSRANQALGTLGVGLSLGALTALTKSLLNGLDALNDVKDATGAAIEGLSALERVAKRNGGTMDTVSGSLIRFNKVLNEVKPDSEAAQILKNIGLSAEQLKKLDPAEALHKTAKALAQFADDGTKARAVQELFGKSVKEAAPFLKDLAEQTQLVGSVTTAQAQEAERFNKVLFDLRTKAEDAGRSIVLNMVDAFYKLKKALDEANPALTIFIGLLGGLAAAAGVGALVTGIRALSGAVLGLGASLLANPGVLALLGVGAVGGIAFGVVKAHAESAEGIKEAIKTLEEANVRSAVMLKRAEEANRMAGAANIQKVIEERTEKIRKLRDELETMTTVATGATGEFSRLDKTLGAALPKMKDVVDPAAIKKAAEEAERQRKKLEEERMKWGRADVIRQAEAFKEAGEAEVKANKEASKAIEEHFKWLGKDADERQKMADAAEDILKKIQDETAGLAMSNVERETAIALRELEASKIDKTSEAYLRLKEAIPKAVADREAAREHKRIWGSIDSTAHDVFVNIFEGGSNAFKKLGQTLKASVLDLLYQMTVKKWIFEIAGSSTGQGISSLVSGGGSAGGGGMLSGISGLFGGGGGAGALSSVLSFAGPIAMGIGLITSLLKGHGETRSGGAYNMGQFVTGPSGGEFGAAGTASKTTVDTINATLAAIGSSSKLTNFFTGVESSEKGKGFAYAGGTLNTGGVFGQGWGAAFSDPAHMNRRGSMNQEQAMAAFTSELKQATLQAIQAATDVPKTISDKLAGLDIDALADTQVDAFLNEINAVITGVDQLRQAAALLPFENLKKLSFDAAAALIEFSGGIDNLVSNLNAYYSNFFSGDEQRLQTAKNIKRTLDAAGGTFSLDQILSGSRSQFRQVVEAFENRTDEAGMKFYAALLSVAGAFASITPEMEAATASGDLYAESLRDQASALEDAISKWQGFADSLARFLRELNLGQLAQNSPFEQYRKTSAEFNRLAAMDPKSEERMAGLEEAGRAFLEASQAYNASNETYFMDLAKVKGAVEASELAARSQLAIAQAQLAALLAIQANTTPGTVAAATAAAAGGGAAFGGSATGGMSDPFGPDYWRTLAGAGGASGSGGFIGLAGANYGGTGANGGTGGAFGAIPSFDVGTNRVPHDMLAFLHKDEAVTPARYNPAVGGGDNGELIAEIRGLRAENQKLNTMFASYAQRDLQNGEEIVDNTKVAADASTSAMVQPMPIPA